MIKDYFESGSKDYFEAKQLKEIENRKEAIRKFNISTKDYKKTDVELEIIEYEIKD